MLLFFHAQSSLYNNTRVPRQLCGAAGLAELRLRPLHRYGGRATKQSMTLRKGCTQHLWVCCACMLQHRFPTLVSRTKIIQGWSFCCCLFLYQFSVAFAASFFESSTFQIKCFDFGIDSLPGALGPRAVLPLCLAFAGSVSLPAESSRFRDCNSRAYDVVSTFGLKRTWVESAIVVRGMDLDI